MIRAREMRKGKVCLYEGELYVCHDNQHVAKTVRIGKVRDDGQIDEIWNSGQAVSPDPWLETYEWAAGFGARAK